MRTSEEQYRTGENVGIVGGGNLTRGRDIEVDDKAGVDVEEVKVEV